MTAKIAVAVMIIEDDPVITNHLQIGLIDSGYTISSIHQNIIDIEGMADLQSPDLIFLDFEFSQQVSSGSYPAIQERLAEIPIIYIAKNNDAVQSLRALGIASFGYLQTPIQARELQMVSEIAFYKQSLDRRMHDYEQEFRNMHANLPIPICMEDLSAVHERLEELKKSGVKNIRKYLSSHPEELMSMAANIVIINSNQECKKFIQTTEPNSSKRTLATVLDEDSLPAILEEVVAFSEGKTRFESDFKLHSRTGEKFFVHASLMVLPGFENSLSQVIVTVHDITAQKKNEIAIRNSEEKFRTLFETMVQGVIYYDQFGWVISINRAAELILGVKREKVENHQLKNSEFEIYHEDGSIFTAEEYPSNIAIKFGIPIYDQAVKIYNPVINAYRWVNVTSIPQFQPGEHKPYQVYSTIEDITERRMAEQKLRESEERLRLITSQVPDWITQFDQNGNIEFSNRWIDGTSNESIGSTIFSITPTECHPIIKSSIEKAFTQGLHSEYEAQLPDDQIETRWFLNRIIPIYGNGKVESVVQIGSDITEQKYVLNALLESEEKYRLLFNTMQEAFALHEIICDRSGQPIDYRFIEVNPAFGKITNLKMEKVIGSTIRQLIGDVEPQWIENYGRVALSGVPAHFYGNLDHSGRLFEVSAFSPKYGQFACTYTDVTDRLKMQEDLRQERNLISRVMETTPTGVLVIDKSGRIVFSNQMVETLFEVTKEQLIDPAYQPPYCVTSKTGIYFPGSTAVGFEIFSTETFIITDEMTIQWPDGHSRVVAVNAAALFNDLDEIYSAVIVFNDITERQQQMLEIERLLEQAQARATELETIADISAAMRLVQTQEELVSVLTDRISRTLEAHTGLLALVDGEAFVISAGYGPGNTYIGEKINYNKEPFWETIRTGQPLTYEAITEDEMARLSPFNRILGDLSACAIVPLRSGDTTIGLIFIGYKTPPDTFSGKVRLLSAIADMAGNALTRMSSTEALERLVSDRTKELETLYRVTSVVNDPISLHQALDLALEQTLLMIKSENGGIFLLDETETSVEIVACHGMPEKVLSRLARIPLQDSLEGQVILENRPLIIDNLSADSRVNGRDLPVDIHTFTSVPIRTKGKAIGALSITRLAGQPLNLEEMTLISSIADHIGLVVDNTRLHKKAEQTAVLEERSRLARELHDSVTQSLYGATLFADAAEKFAEMGQLDQACAYLPRLSYVSQQALKEMRLLVYELRSPKLEKEGLISALDHRLDSVERRAGVHAVLDINDEIPLSLNANEMIYRIILEALNNILKHAQASEIRISIQIVDKWVEITVHDNGKGFDPRAVKHRGGMGLTTMRERAERLGGELDIHSNPDQGTKISIRIPVESESYAKNES
jgi:PAS domain S-box-containing protein